METSDFKGVKVLLAGVLWIGALVFGCAPICVMHFLKAHSRGRQRCRQHVGLISCLTGGVFLGTGMLHLFPEVRENVEEAKTSLHFTTSYPLAEFAMLYGFLVVLCIEQVVLAFKQHPNLPHNSDQHWDCSSEASEETPLRHNAGDNAITEHQSHNPVPSENVLRTVLLVGALSMHALLEGVAVGMELSLETLLATFVAVALHKAVLALSLGLNLCEAGFKLQAAMWSLMMFSLMCPLGIIIALFIEEKHQTPTSIVIKCALQGAACGTFLFVIFFEVLPRELHGGHRRLPRLLLFLLGYSTICALLLLG